MTRFVLRRVVEALISLIGVSILVFALSRASGDPVPLMLGSEATVEDQQAMREHLGLDQPLPSQYGTFVGRLAHGDLGESVRFDQPAWDLISERLPNSLLLAVCALGFATVVGVGIGILSARRPGGGWDRAGRLIAMMGQSVPTFWVGLLLVLLFALTWRLFPPSNFDGASSVVLPALTLGWYSTAALLRITRSSMREALDSHYIAVAKSKGLPDRLVVGRHALRNCLVSILSMGTIQFILLVNGAVITETIFNWPGMGSLMVEAAFSRDYPLVQAVVVVVALLAIAVNLLTDIAYAYIDPRIRFE